MLPGSRALFDPGYLPKKLLHRDQELCTLTKLLSPLDESSLPLNIMVHGSFGIGRTTLLRFFGHHELSSYRRPLISFHMKNAWEIVCDTLNSLGASTTATTLPELWSLLKRIVRKAEVPIIFTFDDVDRRNSDTYTKYLDLCKECGIPSMATAPRYFPRQLALATSQQLDYSFELEPYTDQQFLDIVLQRFTAAFPLLVFPTIAEFIADIICALDFQRPATVVELLRPLYPLVLEGNELTADHIRQACLTSSTLHYDFWSSHLATLTNLEVTTILLLQAIGEYFLSNPGRIYIPKPRLFLQYSQVCERIGFTPTSSQFSRALNELLFQDLLLRSRYNSQNFFTLFPPQGYLEIVELLLSEVDEC